MIVIMPGRAVPFINGEIYHVFNRGIDRRLTFMRRGDYYRAIETLNFYLYRNPPCCLSRFFRFKEDRQVEILNSMAGGNRLVQILCYCLMPNHFHLLLRQLAGSGISKFVGNFLNSYTRFFNTKNNRDGSLFLDQFKAVRIESEGQLVHVSRYIHLNPYSSGVVKNLDDLPGHPWSSLAIYLGNTAPIPVETDTVLSLFKDGDSYKKFVFDNADYQRNLKMIEYLILDDPPGHPN